MPPEGTARRRRGRQAPGSGEAAAWEAALSEEIEAMCRAMVVTEQAGASEDLLAGARSMIADMKGAAGSQRTVEVVPAPPEAEAARAPGTRRPAARGGPFLLSAWGCRHPLLHRGPPLPSGVLRWEQPERAVGRDWARVAAP